MSIVSSFSINSINPSTVGGTGTGIKYFPNLSGNIGAAGLVSSLGGAVSGAASNGYVFCPGVNKANGIRLSALASGNFTIGNGGGTASPVVTVGLYPVTFYIPNPGNAPPTISPTPIISQAFAAAGDLIGYYPWSLSVDLQGDNLTGLLQAMNGNISIDGIAGSFSNSIPLNLAGSLASTTPMNVPVPYGLLVGVTFSISDPLAQANMYEFSLSNRG